MAKRNELSARARRVLRRLNDQVDTPADFKRHRYTLDQLRTLPECGASTLAEIARWAGLSIVEARKSAVASAVYRQLLTKAVEAYEHGFSAWEVQSTGERVAVALVLNRPEWLTSMGFTLAAAVARLDNQWLSAIPDVARELDTMQLPSVATEVAIGFGPLLGGEAPRKCGP